MFFLHVQQLLPEVGVGLGHGPAGLDGVQGLGDGDVGGLGEEGDGDHGRAGLALGAVDQD